VLIVTDGRTVAPISPALREVLAAAAVEHLRTVHRLGGRWDPNDAAAVEILVARSAQARPGGATDLAQSSGAAHDGSGGQTRLLRAQDVAGRLQVSTSTVRRIPVQELPRISIGRSVRYRPQDVARYVEEAVDGS
jgi:predicted DNA-binding transcriptional regulator AlpA